MKTYNRSVAAIQQYEKDLAVYQKAVDRGDVEEPDMKRSVIAQLKEFQAEGKNISSLYKSPKTEKKHCK